VWHGEYPDVVGEPDVSICKFFFNVGNFLPGFTASDLVISNNTRRIIGCLVGAADAEASLRISAVTHQ
jgi:hypothetical protein